MDEEADIFLGPTAPTLREANIGQLLDEQHCEHPARTALVCPWQQRRLTYQDLHKSCHQVARSLLHFGVRPKDHIVVLAGNSVEYAQLFLAAGAIGAIFGIINTTLVMEEALAAIRFLNPVAIFVATRIGYRNNQNILAELGTRKLADRPIIVRLGADEKTFEGVISWDEFLASAYSDDGQSDEIDKYWAKSDCKDTLCVQFTSGTTGPRKAAMLSHSNLIQNAQMVGDRLAYTPQDVVCCCAPLSHCFGLVCGLLTTIMFGGAVALPSDVFIADATLETLSEETCTVVVAVGAMFQSLLDSLEGRGSYDHLCLRTGIIAGAALSRDLISSLSVEFGLGRLAYGYGMTELSCIVLLTKPSEEPLLDNLSSVGTLLPHTAAKVVDTGPGLRVLPSGSVGELLVSGHLVFQGYFQNTEKTEETVIRDHQGRQWVRTGDLVSINEDGHAVIMGRLKDMIKRGGENIFPRDIEDVLEQHPDIAEAAVVGIPDDYWGEVVGAFVKRRVVVAASGANANITARELKVWLRKRVAPHKVPEFFFWLGEDAGAPGKIPTNHTGKVLKAELREIAAGMVQRRANVAAQAGHSS